MSFKKNFRIIFNLFKFPLSYLKTYFIKYNFLFLTESKFRSTSDDGKYPELALKAALDSRQFSVFRRHHLYTPVVETVSKKSAKKYYEFISKEYKLSNSEILQAIKPLQTIGSPRLEYIEALSASVSAIALRYLKVALDIKKIKGDNFGHVVEIGCGYGGQALILDQIGTLESYTFMDLWQVNMLIRRFIESSDFSSSYRIATLRESSSLRDNWDLAISNYAFSELPRGLQINYINKILLKAKNGYMTMNSGLEGGFGNVDNLSQEELQNFLPGCSFSKEIPLTDLRNYLVNW